MFLSISCVSFLSHLLDTHALCSDLSLMLWFCQVRSLDVQMSRFWTITAFQLRTQNLFHNALYYIQGISGKINLGHNIFKQMGLECV